MRKINTNLRFVRCYIDVHNPPRRRLVVLSNPGKRANSGPDIEMKGAGLMCKTHSHNFVEAESEQKCQLHSVISPVQEGLSIKTLQFHDVVWKKNYARYDIIAFVLQTLA